MHQCTDDDDDDDNDDDDDDDDAIFDSLWDPEYRGYGSGKGSGKSIFALLLPLQWR